MKKTVILIFASMLLLTGCSVDTLSKSKPLLNSSEEGYGTSAYVRDKNSIEDDIKSTIISNHKMSNLATLLVYAASMSAKVDEVNKAGGGSSDVVTTGNATIDLIQDLSDYIYETPNDEYDANYVYDELIVIRDNMKSIGFLD